MAREYTRDECRKLLIEHIWMMIGYWNTVKPLENEPPILQRDRLSGLAHSLLTMIDGNSMGMPGFLLAPAPHDEDKAFNETRGENWWPGLDYHTGDLCDIAGGLHEILYKNKSGG